MLLITMPKLFPEVRLSVLATYYMPRTEIPPIRSSKSVLPKVPPNARSMAKMQCLVSLHRIRNSPRNRYMSVIVTVVAVVVLGSWVSCTVVPLHLLSVRLLCLLVSDVVMFS